MKLLGKKVLIRKEPESETTKGGIILAPTNSVDTNKAIKGEVIEASPSYVEAGITVELDVKKGDQVLFFRTGAVEVVVNDEKLLLIDCDNLLAVL